MAGRTATGRGSSEPAILRPHFVGRDRDLTRLTTALETAAAVVLVEGESGIGKSRLIEELLEGRPDRHDALLATCPPFREPFTLGPVVDALRAAVDDVTSLGLSALAGALRPLFPEWADELPAAPAALAADGVGLHTLFRALAELLDRCGIELLVVEDVHWADQATLDFLLFLAWRRSENPRLLVSYRPEDIPEDSVVRRLARRPGAGGPPLRLSLAALDVSGTAALLSSMLGEDTSPEFVAFMHARTEGVPLALEETMRLLHDRRDVTRRDGAWVRRHLDQLEVPPSLRDSVLERTARLGDATRAVLRAAAVLTDPAEEDVIVEVCDLDPAQVRPGLSEAITTGLLQRTGRFRIGFRHVLAGRAVYDAIPAPDRALLHLRAGRALERRPAPPPAALTRHFREAGQTTDWCQYAELGAERAQASGDELTAVSLLFDVAVHADLSGPARAEVVDRIAFSTSIGPDRSRALVEVLRGVLQRETLTPQEDGEVRYQLGRMLTGAEDFATAFVELERAVPHLEQSPLRAVRAMLYLGDPRGTDLPAAVHLDWLRRAGGVIETMQPLDRLRNRVDRALGLLMLGEEEGWREAERIPDRPSSASERLHVLRGHLNISHAALAWGQYDEVRRRLARAKELVDAERDPHAPVLIVNNQGRLDWFTGAWGGLAERMRASVDSGSMQSVGRLESLLVEAQLRAAAGDVGEPVAIFGEVYAEARRLGGVAEAMESAAALGRIHLGGGAPELALQVTEEPTRVLISKGIWIWASDIGPVRVAALVRAGRCEEAASLVEAFALGMRGHSAPAAIAALVTCQAMVLAGNGEAAEAAKAFEEAASAWEQLPRPYDALRAREGAAMCLLGDPAQETAGAESLVEVFDGFADLGARGDANRLITVLQKHGVEVRRPWWGGSKGYGDRLSPRELEVVRMLVVGGTNREIAAALHRSPHTVASQLNSAMRKLGVTTRTALAVSAVEAGLVPDESQSAPHS